jgi:hypothetical protein
MKEKGQQRTPVIIVAKKWKGEKRKKGSKNFCAFLCKRDEGSYVANE